MPRPRKKRPVSVKIYLGADGLWHGWLTVGTKPNGKPDRRHRSGRTEEECADKIRELEDAQAAGKLSKPGRAPTVEEWVTTWLTEIAPYGRRPLRPSTLRSYWSECRTWIFPHLGGIRVDQLDTDDLDRLYAAMYEAGKASSHVLKVHAIIRRALGVALPRGKVSRNVAQLIDNPGAAKGKKRIALSKEQARMVLAAIERRPDALRWKLGLAVGPRQGEVLAIRWQYLDLDEGTVDLAWQIQRRTWRHGCDDPYACGARFHRRGVEPCPGRGARHDRYHRRGCPKVRRSCPPGCVEHARKCPQRRDGGLVFCRPKQFQDEDASHIVALPASLMKEFRRHQATQRVHRVEVGPEWEDNDLVFCTGFGEPIDPRRDWSAWREILREVGLAEVGTHVMRHSAATLLLDMGEDLAVIQEVLGHADIRTTRGYAAVSVGLTRRAAKRMDKGLFGRPATDLATRRRAKGS